MYPWPADIMLRRSKPLAGEFCCDAEQDVRLFGRRRTSEGFTACLADVEQDVPLAGGFVENTFLAKDLPPAKGTSCFESLDVEYLFSTWNTYSRRGILIINRLVSGTAVLVLRSSDSSLRGRTQARNLQCHMTKSFMKGRATVEKNVAAGHSM